MNTPNPFFSIREINNVDAYTRFFHTRAYLRQRSDLFQGPESNRVLMATVGYKKHRKFNERRRQWDVLARDIPLSYLEGIGASRDVLTLTAEADMAEFRAALALPLIPKYGIERIIPGIYGTIVFPNFTSEAEAVTWLRVYSNRTQHECCISYPQLKAIFVKPDGRVAPQYFAPTLTSSKSFLLMKRDGRAIGTSSLGR
jgi:hypothetical protein